jgi:prepilin-type N-terminal cleavage/methylation domain-containing protein
MVGPQLRIRVDTGSRRLKQSAFTLIEVLVVCLLISIILTVGVPVLRDALFNDPLNTTTRKIISTLRGLREEVLRERQPFFLYLDLEHSSFWHDGNIDMKQKKNISENKIQLPPSVRIIDVWTKSGGKQNEGTVALLISRQGYMDMTVIHLTDEREIKSIMLSPFLGSIKVVDGYADLQ